MTAGELLTGDIIGSLLLLNNGNGTFNFEADVQFTGGSLVEGIDQGRIDGLLFDVPGPIEGDFTGAGFAARIGAVNAIPLPAAAWLLIWRTAFWWGVGVTVSLVGNAIPHADQRCEPG